MSDREFPRPGDAGPARVLVLGAYGLIGAAIVRELGACGFRVSGLGRSRRTALRTFPDLDWRIADLSRLSTPEDWQPPLGDIDIVVNASGVLQDGAGDGVVAVQRDAMLALYRAAESLSLRRIVQVSAPDVTPSASTAFQRTKAEADATLGASSIDHVILRPGLVLGREAYGGTALLRLLAALPGVVVLTLGDRPVRTVALEDVARAARMAVDGTLPSGTAIDLVSPEETTLREIVLALRAWLGLPPPLAVIDLPAGIGRISARIGDLLGYLGWRSPLRSTAMRILADGVGGDPADWRRVAGHDLGTVATSLAAMPATAADLMAARAALALPLAIKMLALFWLASGIIGLADTGGAAQVLSGSALPAGWHVPAVVTGSLVDIGLGLAIVVRRLVRPACLGMIVTSLSYLAGASILVPDLWADPLGSLVKVVPAIALAAVVALLAGGRR